MYEATQKLTKTKRMRMQNERRKLQLCLFVVGKDSVSLVSSASRAPRSGAGLSEDAEDSP